MKTKFIGSRNFHQKLAAYSATAGAALTLSPSADATIQNLTTFSVNNGVSFSTTAPNAHSLMSSPANVLFTAATAGHNAGFKGVLMAGLYYNVGAAGIHKPSLNTALSSNPPLVMKKLALNVPVVESSRLIAGTNRNFWAARHSSRGNPSLNFGSFVPSGPNATATGYVGFKSNWRGHTYFGWLRIKVTDSATGYPDAITLIDKNGDGIFGAFGLSSDSIKAGQTALAVPEPSIGGLCLLALGAAGVRELRRRRKANKQ
jgi:hypothetical protein